MSTPSAPVIPPRPSRSPRHGLDAPSADFPKIPPRPVNRRIDRSVSPMRDSYAPSPLNGPPNGSGLSRTTSNDLPSRPPSVTIPSLGEEGIEYDDLPVNVPSNGQYAIPTETRNVSSDLKLHAPKPSLPTSSAKAQVQAVTRTDSHQAAAAGFGSVQSPGYDESEHRSRSLYSKPSGSRAESSTASTNRRQSLQFDEEHGIPEIGQRVPMYPNAGDVQAPSPAPAPTGSATGHRPGRHHLRTRSGRDVFLPPGSYGLHGHGVHAIDKFEKAWYDKHPDEHAREEKGQYGPAIAPRPDWALSREDLNRIVRSSATKGSGLGTSPAVAGTPEEEVGYIASEEYTRQDSQPTVESPLRIASFPTSELERTHSAQSAASSDTGNRVIHVDDPYHTLHHPDGYAQTPEHQPHDPIEDAEHDDEPILAADEVRPESAFLHPAISPTFDRRASTEAQDSERIRSRTPSAPNSRPSSLHGAPASLSRWNSRGEEYEDSHTPLEDVEEYEPLFPEDEKSGKTVSTAERFKKRTELLKHRFPSQDIWEDTPDSLQYTTSVSTPDLPKEDSGNKFEHPDAEEARKNQTEQIDSHKVASHILESHGPFPEGRPTRPDTIKQRFPSRDIWEDTPDSQNLVTTIEPSDTEIRSPDAETKLTVPTRPSIPARPQRPAKSSSPEEKATSPTEARKAPALPDRPKPQVPTHSSKPVSRDANAAAPPAPKAKPSIPARPTGGKIASLKAGFLSDLNSRLQLGPQGPKPAEKKEEEAPVEKGPLSDARKGRARGPTRRKPAATTETKRLLSIPEIRIMDARNVWEVGADGNLVVLLPDKNGVSVGEKPAAADIATESGNTTMAPPIAKNVAGESVDPSPANKESEATTKLEPAVPSIPTNTSTEEQTSNPPETSPIEAEPKPESIVEAKGAPNDEPQTAYAVPADTAPKEGNRSSSQDTVSDDDLEQMAAIADGKRESDGDVHTDGIA